MYYYYFLLGLIIYFILSFLVGLERKRRGRTISFLGSCFLIAAIICLIYFEIKKDIN